MNHMIWFISIISHDLYNHLCLTSGLSYTGFWISNSFLVNRILKFLFPIFDNITKRCRIKFQGSLEGSLGTKSGQQPIKYAKNLLKCCLAEKRQLVSTLLIYTESKAWSSCSNSLSFTSNEYSIQPVIESVSGDSCDLRRYTIIRPT